MVAEAVMADIDTKCASYNYHKAIRLRTQTHGTRVTCIRIFSISLSLVHFVLSMGSQQLVV